MEDYADCDDEYYYNDEEDEEDDDRELLNGFQDFDNDVTIPDRKGSSIEVITRESLLAAQSEDLHRIMDVLSLKEHHARTLLIHYRWDVEKVLAVLVERGKDQLYMEAGVKVTEHSNSCSSSSLLMCDICIEEKPAKEFTTMDCGHYFCNDCWTEHFVVRINEGQSRRIRCMAHKCNAICDDGRIRNLVSVRDSAVAKKFDRYLLESYIEDNKRVKWCPSVPHCGNAIRVEDDELCEVECACGHQFCFGCSCEAHSPCSCLMWEHWVKKCQDESETVNWITSHTKSCPKCHKPVEKNGGCNLVVCVCGQAFCWLCGAATGREHTWSSIAGHSCGRFKEDHEKKAERAKKDWWRYIFYHDRYKAHRDSYKLEANLKETMHQKISTLENRESTYKDFSWVTNGLFRLFRSRRILAYSYPFAYYMFGEELFGNEMTKEERERKRDLFEDQQQQLEANVEKLSMCLEEPFHTFEDDKVQEIKMRILPMTVVVDNLCRKMYECIDNDLLDSLQQTTHTIAPYKSKGLEKASELSSWQIEGHSSGSYSSSIGGGVKGLSESAIDLVLNQDESGCSYRKRTRAESSGLVLDQDESGCSSKKHATGDSFRDKYFDLNLPADMINNS